MDLTLILYNTIIMSILKNTTLITLIISLFLPRIGYPSGCLAPAGIMEFYTQGTALSADSGQKHTPHPSKKKYFDFSILKAGMSPIAFLLISIFIPLSIYFVALGAPSVYTKCITFNAGLYIKVFLMAFFMAIGDTIALRLSNAPKPPTSVLKIIKAIHVFIIGLINSVTVHALMVGVSVIFPKSGVFSSNALIRAFLVFPCGAPIIALLYNLYIPSFWIKKFARIRKLRNLSEIEHDYSIENSIIKTWRGVKKRWLVIIYNYFIMNILPFKEIWWGLGIMVIMIYSGWESSKKETHGKFWEMLYHKLRRSNTTVLSLDTTHEPQTLVQSPHHVSTCQ